MVKNKPRSKISKSEKSKDIPQSLKVISIVYYVWAGLLIAFGVLLLLGVILGGSYLEFESFQKILDENPALLGEEGIDETAFESFKDIVLVVGFILFLILIGLGILHIFVGRGLVRKKKWAWITAIVLTVFGVLWGISGSSSSLVMLVINLVIGYFLIFDKDVRKVFT